MGPVMFVLQMLALLHSCKEGLWALHTFEEHFELVVEHHVLVDFQVIMHIDWTVFYSAKTITEPMNVFEMVIAISLLYEPFFPLRAFYLLVPPVDVHVHLRHGPEITVTGLKFDNSILVISVFSYQILCYLSLARFWLNFLLGLCVSSVPSCTPVPCVFI